jgi:hypothetical protein
MAQVFNNIFVRGLTGAVGDQFVIRRTRSGRTIVANKPKFDPNREFSKSQKSHQEAFRQAAAYARSAKTQPLYVEKAKAMNSIAYNVAISDWFGKPEVLDIDASNWTGEIGQIIRVKAQDNVKVASVRVVIGNGDGTVSEQGEAVQSTTDGSWWIYTTTTLVARTLAVRVEATAKDLPGNFGGSALELN